MREHETTSTTVSQQTNPFPGLRPFRMEEHHLFFGREGQTDEVLLKLSKNRFVGIIGPSGSGKSSFVYCGVLPILYGGFLTEAGSDWKIIVSRPGSSPIDNLANAILKSSDDYNETDEEENKIKRTITSTLLRSSSLGLVEAIQQQKQDHQTNYLILVDQYEELFRYKLSGNEGKVNELLAFNNLLMEAVNYDQCPIYVALTMRSDFVGECATYPEVTRKLNDSHYLIPQMTREQKRRAITGPAAVAHSSLSPRLLQQLLNDLGDNPDQLPILQHALLRTWDYWYQFRESEDEPIDIKHYEAIGTMKEALSLHANEAYDELDEEQKRICEFTFKALTEKRGDQFGIRRPTQLRELAAICNVSETEVVKVIDKFREHGRSLVTPDYSTTLNSNTIIDISHESIMRIWTRLKNWVDDEAESVQMYMRLAEAASMHQIGKGGLWRPPDLLLALNWKTKHQPTLLWGKRYHPAYERTMLFVEYSKKEYETEQRVKELEAKRKLKAARIIAIIMGALLFASLLAVVYAFVQRGVAQEEKLKVEIEKQRAEKSEKEALEQKQKADENAEKARIQAENAERARILADEEKLRADANAQRATLNAERARASEIQAQASEKLAIQKEKDATLSARNAKVSAERFRRERYRTLAKAMALKSKDFNDLEEESLVAQQAYLFNNQYGGYRYDNDIYNGLYTALKKQNDPITHSLEAHKNGAARALAVDAANNYIYSGGSDGRIFQWVYQDGGWNSNPIVQEDRSNSFQVYSLAISPNGRYLLAGGMHYQPFADNHIEFYNVNSLHAEPKIIRGFSEAIEEIIFLPDNRGFYALDESGFSIKFSKFRDAQEVIRTTDKITALSLSADGSVLVGVSKEGQIFWWKTKHDHEETVTKITDTRLTAVSFTPNGHQLVVGDETGLVRIIQNNIVVNTLSGHTSSIEKIHFSHGGGFLATASKDYQVRLWNVAFLNQPPIILSNHDWVWDVAFTPDDSQVMLAIHSVQVNITDVDQTINTYPTKIEQMGSLLCGYVGRNLTEKEWKQHIGSDLPYEITCPNISSHNTK